MQLPLYWCTKCTLCDVLDTPLKWPIYIVGEKYCRYCQNTPNDCFVTLHWPPISWQQYQIPRDWAIQEVSLVESWFMLPSIFTSLLKAVGDCKQPNSIAHATTEHSFTVFSYGLNVDTGVSYTVKKNSLSHFWFPTQIDSRKLSQHPLWHW